MRHVDPELREILVGEYVLGTLRGRARARFEAQLATDAGLREAVARWEARLAPLAEAAPAIAPPLHVRAESLAAPREETLPAGARERRRTAGRSPLARRAADDVGLWRGLALVASAAAIALALLRTPAPAPVLPPPPQYVALLLDPKSATPAFVFRTGAAPGELLGKALQPGSVGADRSLELWLLPPGGAAPRSLGLVAPSGACTLRLAPEIEAQLRDAAGLAVSLEPAGGSPTGAPTGPVLYHGPVVSSSL
ncbi:MAG TPA: anti-sigma factor [Myxococcota bacterium]|jgi:anti-sigma-K factor RskA|nr:anti-sigma factor [Myxococcota bacterium]